MPRGRFAHLLAGLAVMVAPLLAASAMPALAGAPGQEPAPAAASRVRASSKPACTNGAVSPGEQEGESCDPGAVDEAATGDEGDVLSEPAETPSDPSPSSTPRAPGESSAEGSVIRIDLRTFGVERQKRSARLALAVVAAAAVDNEFRPMELTVTVGTSVVWTNEGQNPHTVTADDRAFDSGTLESGQTFSVTFDEVGRVPYYCQIHGEPGSGMFGIVIVRAAQAEEGQEESPTDEAGGLAHTGLDPIPIALTALALAIAGLSSLGAARARGHGRR